MTTASSPSSYCSKSVYRAISSRKPESDGSSELSTYELMLDFNSRIFSSRVLLSSVSLEESISSFYAEILRIKILIEACKRGEKIFFLLDEIFKGTNSKDRHIGATVLIKQLIKYGGVGLVSTHDLELCDLEKENKNIINYNFREFYENDKIKFDYILRRGKSKTQNAIHLMKLAGIEIDAN